ncbi:MAG TPA: GAF domain-containing sensor histidine kinase [Chloroflexota bacterium]|nr:GAF domain-containing sensor histidine kinase [Chloroflexota bacterium]
MVGLRPPAAQPAAPAVARGAWALTAALVASLYAAAIPAAVTRLTRLCTAGPACAPGELTPAALPRLAELGLTPELYALILLGLSTALALVYAAVSGLLVGRRPDDRMALYAAFTLLLFGPVSFAGVVPLLGELYPALRLPVGLLQYAAGALFTLFVFVFPDGRFVPGWTRWVALVWVVGQMPPSLAGVLPPGARGFYLDVFRNACFVVGLAAAAGAQLYRYRRISTQAQRQQTKWTALGFALALGGYLGLALATLPAPPGPRDPGLAIAVQATQVLLMSLIPLSIGVAVLRHRLYDVDRLINRALVYAALTASVVLVYVLVVGYLGLLLRTGESLVVSLVGTGAAALLFQPLRERLQRAANRLVYGRREEPYAVLSRLGERLEATLAPGAALPAVAETVAQALRAPYAAVRVARAGGIETAASVGAAAGAGATVTVPLLHQGEVVGELVVGLAEPDEEPRPAERRLLEDIARRAGAAVHAARLADELQRSRERLVTAREEERRRLRRELHDGLGPTLAALTLKLETARNRLADDPLATRLLAELAQRTQATVADVRRTVHDLRPPALDELGLVGALRRAAGGLESRAPEGLRVDVVAEEPLPPLSAAVEVAAYRIVQEALTNVARHADAGRARVRLAADGRALVVEVADDGRGLPAVRRPGVGLASMRERAEELGGACAVEPGEDGRGTRVRARLPLVSGR